METFLSIRTKSTSRETYYVNSIIDKNKNKATLHTNALLELLNIANIMLTNFNI